VVDRLARFIATTEPGMRGFTRRNLFRMRRFYETYREDAIVTPLVSQLPWSHHLVILEQSKRPEEREFYLPSPHSASAILRLMVSPIFQ
jgi:predicted nuclease of restriction endonuclease-like (RecB) superfamily